MSGAGKVPARLAGRTLKRRERRAPGEAVFRKRLKRSGMAGWSGVVKKRRG